MYGMLFIACMFLIGGLFLVFRISIVKFIEDIIALFSKSNNSIYKMQRKLNRKESKNPFVVLIKDIKYILDKTNRGQVFTTLVIISAVGLCFSIFASIMLSNVFLFFPLSASCVLLPFIFFKLTARTYEMFINHEIETALSIITTSYLRTDDIVSAIKENINYMNPPVRDVFETFLLQQRLIQSNIELAILNMKDMLKNSIFHEWCDTLCACQNDRSIRHILPSIVTKLSDARSINAELDIIMYEPVRELNLIIILALANIPFIYFLNRDWFMTLFTTTVGKFLVALNVLVCFIAVVAVIVFNKPVEFKR